MQRRRIPVLILDSSDKVEGMMHYIQSGTPFIARPKRGKNIMKLMNANETDMSMMGVEMQTFMEKFDQQVEAATQKNGKPPRSSRLLECARSSGEFFQVLSCGDFDPEQAMAAGTVPFAATDIMAEMDGKLTRETKDKAILDAMCPRAAGLARGSTYAGIESSFLPSARWQFAGSRLLAIARPCDVGKYFETQELSKVLQCLKELTPDSLKAGSLPTFMVNQVTAGDMVFLPFGFIFCEKATNAASITIRATVELLSPEGRDDFNQFCSQIPEGHVSAALQNMMPKLNFAAAPPVTVPPAPASVGHGVDGADSAMEEPNGETDEKSQSHGIKAEVKVEKRDESGPGQDNRSLGAVAPAAAEIASSGNDDAADAQDAPPEDRAAPPREAAEAVAPADHASPSATAPAGEAAEALVAADHVATVATALAEEAAQPPVAADHASPETAEALVAADHVATVATAPAEKAAQPPVAADHASPEAAEALAAANHVATVATAPAEEAAQPPVAADHVALCATAAPVEAAEAAPSAAAP
ncbi:unnamed protein product, partial [Cladocopium goreaui]